MAKKIDEAILELLRARKVIKEDIEKRERELATHHGYLKGLEDAIEMIEEAAKDA